MTDDGRDSGARQITAQICDVHRPLMSVKGMCRSGHRVIFDEDGSYVENKTTLDRIKIDEVDGEYVLGMWVKSGCDGGSSAFAGQRT